MQTNCHIGLLFHLFVTWVSARSKIDILIPNDYESEGGGGAEERRKRGSYKSDISEALKGGGQAASDFKSDEPKKLVKQMEKRVKDMEKKVKEAEKKSTGSSGKLLKILNTPPTKMDFKQSLIKAYDHLMDKQKKEETKKTKKRPGLTKYTV